MQLAAPDKAASPHEKSQEHCCQMVRKNNKFQAHDAKKEYLLWQAKAAYQLN